MNSTICLGGWEKYLPADAITLAGELASRADAERAAGHTIFPPQQDIFNALLLTPPESVKAVIIGQDCYYRAGQAMGLAFSVRDGVPLPRSLKNIFKELHSDLGIDYPSGDLTSWAKHGVLLLNTALTVEEGKPASHTKLGWDKFVLAILNVCVNLPQPIVFALWGGYARAVVAGLQISAHPNKASVWSSHPSPLGATKGNEVVPAFIGSKPFSVINKILTQMGAAPIDWSYSPESH